MLDLVYQMEQIGIFVDPQKIRTFADDLDVKVKDLATAIYSLSGESFNLSSSQQLGCVLFEKLGLPSPKKRQRLDIIQQTIQL